MPNQRTILLDRTSGDTTPCRMTEVTWRSHVRCISVWGRLVRLPPLGIQPRGPCSSTLFCRARDMCSLVAA